MLGKFFFVMITVRNALHGLIALVMKLPNLKCEILSPNHSRDSATFTQSLYQVYKN